MIGTKKEKLSFIDDFSELLKLSKTEKFSESVTEEFLRAVKQFEMDNFKSDEFFIIYWNRFNQSFQVLFSKNNYSSIDTDLKQFDFVSWIPIFYYSTKKMKRNKDLTKNKKENVPFDLKFLESNKKELQEFFNKFISKNLIKEYHSIFSAKQENDYQYFMDRSLKTSYKYPIDFYPTSIRFEHFWSNLKMFNFRDLDGVFFDFRSIIADCFLVLDDVESTILSKEFKLIYPYNFFEDELIEESLNFLKNKPTSGHQKKKLELFLSNVSSKDFDFQKQVPKRLEIIESNMDYYLKILEAKLFKPKSLKTNEDLFYTFKIVGDNFTPSEKEKAFEIIDNKVFSFLKENCYKPAPYSEFLEGEHYLKFKKSNNLVESFLSESSLFSAINNKNNVVYSPLSSGLIFPKDPYECREMKEVNEFLKNNGIKTTNYVKESIRKIIDSPFLDFSSDELEHLNFVLSMDTID